MKKVYNVNWKTMMQKCVNDLNTTTSTKKCVQWNKKETSQNINTVYLVKELQIFLILLSIFQNFI